MPRSRLVLVLALGALVLLWLALPGGALFEARPRVPTPDVQAVYYDPLDTPRLQPYKRLRDAVLQGERDELVRLAEEGAGSYLSYRAYHLLADDVELTSAERARYLGKALELRVDEPLARSETRRLWLRYATLAEDGGMIAEAREGYERALPLAAAKAGLRRLVENPIELARIFARANQHRDVVETLSGTSVPSLQAPAYRALGRYHEALEAYETWLQLEPDNEDARLGYAWTLFHLRENERAAAVFNTLTAVTPSAYYGLGLVALREGDIDGGVSLYVASGVPRNLWWATDLLEERNRARDALPIYLELAETASPYRAEAAYRALVLAERYGDEEALERAQALLPANSYLGLVGGGELSLPNGDALDEVEHEALELARELARANDLEAAVGELLFALREAEDEATVVALGEVLQTLGEYRQSQRAALGYLAQGSENLRTWRLAYPRAFAEVVEREAERFGVDAELVWAVMRQESAFYPQAVSVANAQGLMQVIPSTWDWIAELLREEPGDPFDIEANIRYGTYYLSWLINYFDGDLELVVPAYNAGQGYIRRLYNAPPVNGDKDEFYRFIDRDEPRDYLQKVLYNYAVYRALYGEEPPLPFLAETSR